METKKTAIDEFWQKLLSKDETLALKMVSEYMECKRLESIQIRNAMRYARNQANNNKSGEDYILETFGYTV
jgi:hypothetical protein